MKQFILMALAAVLLVALGFQTGRIVERRNATPAAAEEHISPAAAINEEEETSMECNGTWLRAENAKILNYKGEEVALGSLAGDSTALGHRPLHIHSGSVGHGLQCYRIGASDRNITDTGNGGIPTLVIENSHVEELNWS